MSTTTQPFKIPSFPEHAEDAEGTEGMVVSVLVVDVAERRGDGATYRYNYLHSA